MSILLAFVTGLTTGGLSCLAVQGGLLAGSIAYEVEQTVAGRPAARGSAQSRAAAPRGAVHVARPIALFLTAKLVAYTVLGFLLGWLGSVLQLTSTMRAVMQIAIGVFMAGNALRMLNVHPMFRYFALEPPSFVTRFIRRRAKDQTSDVTPLFLGALTVLIPCGVTQAMMAVAMGTGSAFAGATIMFAFILGTSPVFFAVAYGATRLGARLERGFMRAVAIVVLVLGLISVDAGLTLMGSPYSSGNLRLTLARGGAGTPAAGAQAPRLHPQPDSLASAASRQPGQGAEALLGEAAAQFSSGPVVTITVVSNGYRPALTHAASGIPFRLALVTNRTYSCARSFVIPSLSIEKVLPPTGVVTIDLPAQRRGSKLFYTCSMGMYSGAIAFDG